MKTHSEIRADKQKEAEDYLRKCGGGVKLRKHGGGVKHDDEAEDRKLIGSMIKAEEHKIQRRKRGGGIAGAAPVARLDRRGRSGGGHVTAENVYQTRPGMARSSVEHPKTLDKRAAGGRVGHGKGKVNVIVHAGGGGNEQMAQQQGMQKGLQLGALMAAKGAMKPPGMPGGAPPMPPPGGPPMAGPPPGAMPPSGMPMRAKGGPVKVEKPKTAAEASRNRKETGHDEYVKVRGHRRRRTGGAV